mgnify:CR=1 FL=1
MHCWPLAAMVARGALDQAAGGRDDVSRIADDVRGKTYGEVKRYREAFWAKGARCFEAGEWAKNLRAIEKGEQA